MALAYEDAAEALQAGLEKARELGVKLSIGVVDDAANPVALARMTGTRRGTASLACQGKAAVAAIWGVPSAETAERLSRNTEIRDHAQHSYGGRLLFLGGGLPLKSADGEVVGAVAASGGRGKEDLEVARAAEAAFNKRAGSA